MDTRQWVITILKAQANKVPEGRYEVAIYQLRSHGIRKDLVPQKVAVVTCDSFTVISSPATDIQIRLNIFAIAID